MPVPVPVPGFVLFLAACSAPNQKEAPDAGTDASPPDAGASPLAIDITDVVSTGSDVELTFHLSGTGVHDVTVSAGGPATVSGQTTALEPGAHAIVWNAAADLPPDTVGLFVVEVSSGDASDVMPVEIDFPLAARIDAGAATWVDTNGAIRSAFGRIGIEEADLSRPLWIGAERVGLPEEGTLERVLRLLDAPLDAPPLLLDLARRGLLARGSIRGSILEAGRLHGSESLPTVDRAPPAEHADWPGSISPRLAAALDDLVRAILRAEGSLQEDPDARATLLDLLSRYGTSTALLQWVSLVGPPGRTGAPEAALLVADALDALRADLALEPPSPVGGVLFDAALPIGRVVVTGFDDDVHDEDAVLVVDLGGNDLYLGAAASTLARGTVSVVVDVSGDDRYGAPDVDGAAGAGILGVGILADLAGHDTYEARHLGIGFGFGGVGVLFDGGGDDAYSGEMGVEGSGIDGIGLVVDVDGTDAYEAVFGGQGFGGTFGVGAIVEGGGPDRYEILHEPYAIDPFYGQKWADEGLPGHGYIAFSQGASQGLRLSALGYPDLAGGIGAIFEGAGDDGYVGADEFGVACGYYYGVGTIVDAGGTDEYDAWDYVTASAQHQGGAWLLDLSGDDRYVGAMDHAEGHGLDMAAGLLFDAAGDDVYEAGRESQGAGVKDAGLGILADADGADAYSPDTISSQGWARDPEPGSPYEPIACFVDSGGDADLYTREGAADGAEWQNGLGTSIGVDR